MRAVLALIAYFFYLYLPCPAYAGMYFRAIMIAPEKVATLAVNNQALEKLIFNPGADDLVLQKEWHGIHYLLNGDPWSTQGPYGQVVLGGSKIGADLGYGPARLLTASQVKEIALRLKVMPADKLRMRYNPPEMDKTKIYPGNWMEAGQESLEWLLDGYKKLSDFYTRAASQGKVVILVIV